MMFIRRAKLDELIEAAEYGKTQLEYINGVIDYFDKSHISKSVTEEAIKRLGEALEKVK